MQLCEQGRRDTSPIELSENQVICQVQGVL